MASSESWEVTINNTLGFSSNQMAPNAQLKITERRHYLPIESNQEDRNHTGELSKWVGYK